MSLGDVDESFFAMELELVIKSASGTGAASSGRPPASLFAVTACSAPGAEEDSAQPIARHAMTTVVPIIPAINSCLAIIIRCRNRASVPRPNNQCQGAIILGPTSKVKEKDEKTSPQV